MKNLIIMVAMLISVATFSQIIDQQIIIVQNIDNYQFVYPALNSYICPQYQDNYYTPTFIEFTNNIYIMEITIPDNMPDELEEYFDPSDGVIYNTTTPDEFEFNTPLPLPLELIPEEDIGVTREKELLH